MLAYLDWNVYGLVIGNVTFALVVCILNWFSIKRALRYRQEILTTFLLPLLASFFMGGAALGIYYGTFSLTQKNSISMLVTVPFAMMVYAVLILLLRVVTEEELPQMPFGRKILILSKKLRLL